MLYHIYFETSVLLLPTSLLPVIYLDNQVWFSVKPKADVRLKWIQNDAMADITRLWLTVAMRSWDSHILFVTYSTHHHSEVGRAFTTPIVSGNVTKES